MITEKISKKFGRKILPTYKDDETFSVEISIDIIPEIVSITVPFSLHGQDLGKKLLEVTCQVLKNEGFSEIGLYTFPFSYGDGNTSEDILSLVKWCESQDEMNFMGYNPQTAEGIQKYITEQL